MEETAVKHSMSPSLWYFPYIVNMLHSHLLLLLDIHWKKTSVLELLIYRESAFMLHTCGCKKRQKSPNPTITQTAGYFTLSLTCFYTVAGGSSMSHHHVLRYLFRQFYKSAALLVWTKYSIGIQAINFHLTAVMLLVPCCSADN